MHHNRLLQPSNLLLLMGYLSLVPAVLFSLLIICGTVMFGLVDGVNIPFRMYWPLGMVASLAAFLVSSVLRNRFAIRLLMYISGAAAVFCAAIFDTYNVVELNAYTGDSGNLVVTGLVYRFACFSTYVGVPMIAVAALLGRSGRNPEQ